MMLTRSDAERLARLLALEIGGYEWCEHLCDPYCPSEFRFSSFYGGTRILYIPLAGDMARQAATLEPEAFIQWYNNALVSIQLTEAETVEWLLAQAPRFDAADVNKSLQYYAFVDFEVPFSYRYDWDGVLRLAAALQSDGSLEYRFHLWLPPAHRDTMIRMEWRASAQDYRIAAFENPEPSAGPAVTTQTAPEQTSPCLEIIGDVDDFGRFFKAHYNSSAARIWLNFIQNNRTPASDQAYKKLREEFTIPLTPADCQPFLQALREGRVWLQSGDLSTEDWLTLGYEDGNYVQRSSEHIIETGMGGNVTYEGPAGNSQVWTQQETIERLQSNLVYRYRLLKLLKAWGAIKSAG